MGYFKIILPGIFFVLMLSCISRQGTAQLKTPKHQNILWLVAEDISPYIPPFLDSTIQTPNLSRFVAEGVRYSNVFDICGVCAPSRAALTTGMYPSGIGADNMRTLEQQPAAKKMGLINYECVPPRGVKMVSEIMRANGYYCTNNAKEDYQFIPSQMAWDESSIYAHWRNRPKGKPFFAIFNFEVTHESQIWNPRWQRYDLKPFPPDRSLKEWGKLFDPLGPKPLFVPENLKVTIPPYLPNTEVEKNDFRRLYSNIVEMDKQVGLILKQLEDDNLLENTIIVWYSDNGGPMLRGKRLLYESGIKIPMIIRYPGKKNEGKVDNQLISFVDFAPTLLSMAGIRPPGYIQGQAFAGKFKSTRERKYVYAASDRLDECYDMIRAVRDKRFKYLRNFKPEKPYYMPLAYREQMASMQELLRMRDAGELNEVQMQWFRPHKPEEELFDTEKDPYEIHSLADNPMYKDKLVELRNECDRWMGQIDDKGFIPEEELIREFWPGKIQPITAAPVVKIEKGKMKISCATEGASIGYKLPGDEVPWIGWRIYGTPVKIPEGKQIKIIAHRIGYAPSDTVIFKNR